MNGKKSRKILTALVVILGLLVFVEALCFAGSGGVLNGLDIALAEMEMLEVQNLLDNPPENISFFTKAELLNFHSSSDLKHSIKEKEYEASFYYRDIYFIVICLLFVVSLLLRIYIRQGKSKVKY